MPVINSSPIPISIGALTDPVARSGTNSFVGPFFTASASYIVQGYGNNVTDPTAYLTVYKSTDGGQNWVAQDAAARPTLYTNGGSTPYGTYCPVPRLLGSKIRILYEGGADSGKMRVIDFDTATDTFGTPSGTSGNTADTSRLFIDQDSNGDDWCVFGETSVPSFNFRIYYQKFSAGAFVGSATVWVQPGGSQSVDARGLYIDANDLLHLVFTQDNPPFTSHAVRHKTLTTGGVQGTDQLIANGVSASDTLRTVYSLIGWNGKLAFSVVYFPDRKARVWYGTPDTSATPVWTSEDIPIGVASVTAVVSETVVALDDNGNLTVWWIVLDYPVDPADIIDRLYYATNTGSGFGSATLYYDERANPQTQFPAEPPEDQFIHILSVAPISGGGFAVVTALELDSVCAGYYLTPSTSSVPQVFVDIQRPFPRKRLGIIDIIPFVPRAPASPQILTLSPLPCATIGEAYSQTLVGQGVAPFTYTLVSGSLPPGLTLSSAGVISGTVSAFAPQIRATNGAGTNTQTFSISVCCPGPVPTDTFSSGAIYSRSGSRMNLKIIRGDSLAFDLIVYLNGVSVDITGGEFRMTAKWSVTDDDSAAVFIKTSTPAAGITITDAANGMLTVQLDPIDTSGLPDHTVDLNYDLQLYDTTGAVYTVLYGILTVIVDVSVQAP